MIKVERGKEGMLAVSKSIVILFFSGSICGYSEVAAKEQGSFKQHADVRVLGLVGEVTCVHGTIPVQTRVISLSSTRPTEDIDLKRIEWFTQMTCPGPIDLRKRLCKLPT